MIQNRVGTTATGDDFFDRHDEVRNLWSSLETDSVLLLAPRRVGKTSLLKRLEAMGPEKGVRVIYTTVESAADELGFIQKLTQAVARNLERGKLWRSLAESPLGRAFERLKGISVSGWGIELDAPDVQGWREWGEGLASGLGDLEGRTVIAVDELPVFVSRLLHGSKDQDRVCSFLEWFRELRQDHQEVRWLLAGSIGLDTVAARLNAGSTVNDLRIEHLGAFSADTADRFLQALAESYGLSIPSEVRRHVVDRVGWPVPYYLQLVFAELRKGLSAPATPADVDRVFEVLLSPAHKAYFDYWRQRLSEELGKPDSQHAIALLNAVCADPSGVSLDILRQALTQSIPDADARAEKLRYLLDVLETDGYLVQDGRRYRFRLPLLREYWMRRVAP